MRNPSIDIELLDRKLYSLVSIGRESAPERIARIEKMRSEVLRYAEMPAEDLPKSIMELSKQTVPFQAAELISSITVGSLLQGFETIERKSSKEQAEAIKDFDSIRMTIACLCYFLVLVGRNFDEEDLSLLFAGSFDYYDEHAEKDMIGLSIFGPNWKQRYGGILPFAE